jgi:hypothetical protein
MPSQARRERIRVYQKKVELRKLVQARVITTAELELLLAAYATQRLHRQKSRYDWE